MDDLSDIVIDPAKRISDDPNDWVLPKSLVQNGDLFDWWEGLRASDDALWDAGLSQQTRETLLWLHGEYVALRTQPQGENVKIPQHLSKIRTVVRHICLTGLTTEQTARLLGESRSVVLRSLFFNKPIPDSDLEARYRCESMLRDGVPQQKIVEELPLTADEVVGMAKMLGIERNVTQNGFDVSIREEAVALRRQGWKNPQIADFLTDKHGTPVRPATVAQWWRRANLGAA